MAQDDKNRNWLDIFNGTILAEFQPNPGSVFVNREIIEEAARILNQEVYTGEKEKIQAFVCFAQLIDSLVLHESVFFRDSLSHPIDVDLKLKYIADLVQPLPGYSEFHERASHLIIENETQAVIGVQPKLLDKDLLAAHVAGIPYKPSPYHTELAKRTIIERENDYYRAFVVESMDRIGRKAAKEMRELNQLLGEPRFKLDSPLVFNYIFLQLPKGGGAKEILEIAREIRESKPVKAYRAICAEFDLAARVGDKNLLYRLKDELELGLDNLNRKFQQSTVDLSIEFPPSISINPPQLWNLLKQKRKRHLLFIEDVYKAALKSEGIRRQFYEIY